MSSSSRTPNLSLNQWSLNDKPQMEDMNRDNLFIDAVVSAHIGDEVPHLTFGEHEKLTKRIVFSEYFGTNAPSNSFTLDINPIFVIVFAKESSTSSKLKFTICALCFPSGIIIKLAMNCCSLINVRHAKNFA